MVLCYQIFKKKNRFFYSPPQHHTFASHVALDEQESGGCADIRLSARLAGQGEGEHQSTGGRPIGRYGRQMGHDQFHLDSHAQLWYVENMYIFVIVFEGILSYLL